MGDVIKEWQAVATLTNERTSFPPVPIVEGE